MSNIALCTNQTTATAGASAIILERLLWEIRYGA